MSARRMPGQAEEDNNDVAVSPPTPTRDVDTRTSTTAAVVTVGSGNLLVKTLAPLQIAPSIASTVAMSSNPPSSPKTSEKHQGAVHKGVTTSRHTRRSHHQSSQELFSLGDDNEMDIDDDETAPGAVRVGGGDDSMISMIAANDGTLTADTTTGRWRSGRAAAEPDEDSLMQNNVSRSDVESQQHPQQAEELDQASPVIVAHLAPDEDDMAERLAERVQAEVERRLGAQQNDPSHQPVLAAVRIEEPDNANKQSSSTSPNRNYWIFLLLLLVVGGIVAGIVVAISGRRDKDTAPTVAPTIVKTPAPTASTDLVDDESALRDDSTGQHWALRWLADTDAAALDFERIPTHLAVERFALVLLHNYTGGSLSWIEQYGFLSSLPVCSWWNNVWTLSGFELRGVVCVGSSVSALVLRENALFGDIPTELGLMTSLTHLDFSTNALFGSITPILSEYMPPNMHSFWVRMNALSGSIPSNRSFPVRESITSIDLSFNAIGGTLLPDFFLQMPNLEAVDLTENLFEGTIPTELALLSNSLEALYFGGNDLMGTIPIELGSLTKLQYFELGQTKITGTIPSELGQLTSSAYLGLYATNLSGQLPSELGMLTTSLIALYVYENNCITGTIPLEYVNLRPPSGILNEFVGHSTSLEGGFEETWCDGTASNSLTAMYDTLSADCLQPDAKVSCSCCTWCCHAGDCVEQVL